MEKLDYFLLLLLTHFVIPDEEFLGLICLIDLRLSFAYFPSESCLFTQISQESKHSEINKHFSVDGNANK